MSRAQKIINTATGEIRVQVFGEMKDSKKEASIFLNNKYIGNMVVEYRRGENNLYTTWIGQDAPTLLIQWDRSAMWEAISKWAESATEPTPPAPPAPPAPPESPRLISLFSGIGADRAAIKGADTVLSCEIDKHAQRTYQSIWREAPSHDDVTKIEALPPSDLLVAGFPCQPYSSAGKRKGLSDPRALIGKVLSLIEGEPPQTVILENVKGILAPQGAETLRMIKERLSALYPHVSLIESCASDFGPMRRPRVFIVASQRGWRAPPLPSPLPPLSAHLSASPEEEEKCRIGERTWSALKAHKEKHAAKGNGFRYQWATENSVPTISARYWKDGSEALLSSPFSSTPRRLHPREISSLFGWEDRWSSPCSNSQAAKQLGNSISIPQLRWIWEGVQ